MTHAVTRYALVTVVTIAFVAWLLTLALSGAGSNSAIGLSAIVAIVIQIGAFAVTKTMASSNVIAAWGAGALVRLVTLFVYAFLAVNVFGLPAVLALFCCVSFFFLSTLLEPVFLRR